MRAQLEQRAVGLGEGSSRIVEQPQRGQRRDGERDEADGGECAHTQALARATPGSVPATRTEISVPSLSASSDEQKPLAGSRIQAT